MTVHCKQIAQSLGGVSHCYDTLITFGETQGCLHLVRVDFLSTLIYAVLIVNQYDTLMYLEIGMKTVFVIGSGT